MDKAVANICLAKEAGKVASKLLEVANAQKQLSEQGVKQSENLSSQTDGLISQVGALIHIADEQKVLAMRLENQTNKIICLTWGLLAFSVALLAVSLVTVKIKLKQNAQANIPQIQSSQQQEYNGTNK